MADVADAQQRLNVGFVRMPVERIDHEDDATDLALDDAARDLDVAAKWPGFDKLDLEANLVFEQLAGRTRGNQPELGQPVAIECGKGNQVGLFAVVGDDCKSGDS